MWYMAQIFPASNLKNKHLNAAVTYFIWRGAIFQVPVAVLHARKIESGLDLTYVAAKCRTLFLCRLRKQGTRRESATVHGPGNEA
jgi:hypothetical protein